MGARMTKNSVKIWIWLQDGKPMKAIICFERGTLEIFDENDTLVLKRTGLNKKQVKKIEATVIRYGAKRLDTHQEPFRYL